jgi:hypothetical protein
LEYAIEIFGGKSADDGDDVMPDFEVNIASSCELPAVRAAILNGQPFVGL